MHGYWTIGHSVHTQRNLQKTLRFDYAKKDDGNKRSPRNAKNFL